MKKIFFKVALCAAIVAAAGWNISQSKKGVELSDVALENVEALAVGEGGGNTHTLECGSSGVKMCKATCGIHQVEVTNYGNGKTATFKCGN